MHDIAAHTYRTQDHGPDLSVVLTVAEPIDGAWQFSLTVDGSPLLTTDTWHSTAGKHMDVLALAGEVTIATDSDAAAAGEHAVDLLRDDFDIAVNTIIYPDGSTIDCKICADPAEDDGCPAPTIHVAKRVTIEEFPVARLLHELPPLIIGEQDPAEDDSFLLDAPWGGQ